MDLIQAEKDAFQGQHSLSQTAHMWACSQPARLLSTRTNDVTLLPARSPHVFVDLFSITSLQGPPDLSQMAAKAPDYHQHTCWGKVRTVVTLSIRSPNAAHPLARLSIAACPTDDRLASLPPSTDSNPEDIAVPAQGPGCCCCG